MNREGIRRGMWLPEDLVAEIDEIRESLGLSFRAVVIAALRAWVKKMKKGD